MPQEHLETVRPASPQFNFLEHCCAPRFARQFAGTQFRQRFTFVYLAAPAFQGTFLTLSSGDLSIHCILSFRILSLSVEHRVDQLVCFLSSGLKQRGIKCMHPICGICGSSVSTIPQTQPNSIRISQPAESSRAAERHQAPTRALGCRHGFAHCDPVWIRRGNTSARNSCLSAADDISTREVN